MIRIIKTHVTLVLKSVILCKSRESTDAHFYFFCLYLLINIQYKVAVHYSHINKTIKFCKKKKREKKMTVKDYKLQINQTKQER